MTALQAGNDQKAGFTDGSCRDFQQSGVPPEGLGGQEVDAVLAQVGVALAGIELKVQSELNPYRFGASGCFQRSPGLWCCSVERTSRCGSTERTSRCDTRKASIQSW